MITRTIGDVTEQKDRRCRKKTTRWKITDLFTKLGQFLKFQSTISPSQRVEREWLNSKFEGLQDARALCGFS